MFGWFVALAGKKTAYFLESRQYLLPMFLNDSHCNLDISVYQCQGHGFQFSMNRTRIAQIKVNNPRFLHLSASCKLSHEAHRDESRDYLIKMRSLGGCWGNGGGGGSAIWLAVRERPLTNNNKPSKKVKPRKVIF